MTMRSQKSFFGVVVAKACGETFGAANVGAGLFGDAWVIAEQDVGAVSLCFVAGEDAGELGAWSCQEVPGPSGNFGGGEPASDAVNEEELDVFAVHGRVGSWVFGEAVAAGSVSSGKLSRRSR